MGTTDYKGITYTYASGAAGVTGILDLDMRTGADVDQTRWLDGAGGSGADVNNSYPGSLTGFTATNDDSINGAGGSLRMLVFDVTCNATGTVTLSSTTITDADSDGEDDGGVVIGAAISRIVAVTGAVSKLTDKMITAAINGSNSLQLDLDAEDNGVYTITLLVE
jgi:hypothetical protein